VVVVKEVRGKSETLIAFQGSTISEKVSAIETPSNISG